MTTLKKFVFCFFLPLIHEESWTFHQTTCWRFLLRKTQILICLPHAMTDVNVSGITTPLPVAALPLPHMLDNGLLPVECTGHKSFIVKCMKCVLKLNSKEWKLFADHRKRDTNSKLRIKCWLLSSNLFTKCTYGSCSRSEGPDWWSSPVLWHQRRSRNAEPSNSACHRWSSFLANIRRSLINLHIIF